jgi:hypothetical protein
MRLPRRATFRRTGSPAGKWWCRYGAETSGIGRVVGVDSVSALAPTVSV